MLIHQIVQTIIARNNCVKTQNHDWKRKHDAALKELARALPSGAGFDAGVVIDLGACGPDGLVLTFDFHPMDENGYYMPWIYCRALVKPAFDGITVEVTPCVDDGAEVDESLLEEMAETLRHALEQPKMELKAYTA